MNVTYPSVVDEPQPNQIVNPNTSFLLADSVSRDHRVNPMPTDFEVQLNISASGARRITHRNMQWSQPFYTHNLKDWELKISFSTDNFVQVYSVFMFPWVTFGMFAGIEKDTQEWQAPDAASYCAMLQEGLRVGYRKVEDKTIISPPPGVPIADFHVLYSKYRGILINLSQINVDPNDPPIYFRIEECSWMTFGHHIHGFGVRKQRGQEWYYAMEDSLYLTGVNLYLSDSVPTGVYTRFFALSSREICRNRKITSFSNLIGSGATNATELNIFPVSFSKLHILSNYITSEDPTVINLKSGDNLQSFRIALVDEFGNVIQTGYLSGNPFFVYASYLASQGIVPPYDLSTTLFSVIGTPNVVYDNDAITAALQDTYHFFERNNFRDARLDSVSAITHLFEMTML